MSANHNKLSRFWQELKRRRVVHVITVYASGAFVIIELINNLTEPLNLPANLFTIVVIILAAGFPLAIILSWLYDLTSEGMEKTKPIEEIKEEEKTVVPNAWKIATYVSFVVIIGLAVLNIMGGGKRLRAGEIQSIVILPFENITGDDQLDNLVSGMHSLLCIDIGRISGLRVISKTTSKLYKGSALSASEIAEELNADGVVEGSIMCLGDSVCMAFSLISTTGEEQQIWSGDYNEDKGQVLNLFNKITKRIAEEVRIELTPEEKQRLAKSRTVDREAFDAYLRGFNYVEDLSEESLLKARDHLNSAIEKDPDWAPLYAALAAIWESLGTMGFESPEITSPIVYEYLNKALELNPDLLEIHYVSAFMAMTVEWNWEKAEVEFLKALAINPNHALSRMHYSILLYMLQRSKEAKIQVDLAYKLDPLNPLIQTEYAGKLLQMGDCESALPVLENVIASDPGNFYANNIIVLAAFHCGDLNRVFETEKHMLPLEEEAINEIEKIYNERGFYAAYEEIMRQKEILAEKSYVAPSDMAFTYYMINQDDKAIEWLEKGAEVHDPCTSWMGTGTYNFTRLYDNPRFIEVLEKMNLPLPSK